MEIRCPKCETVYQVADEKIPDQGIHVRCLKCQSRFFLKKETVAEGKKKEIQKPPNLNPPHEKTEGQETPNLNKTCKCCDRKIEKREVPEHIHNTYMICYECYDKLKKAMREEKDSPSKKRDRLPENQSRYRKPAAKGRRSLLRRVASFSDIFSKDLAIDLGTANTLVYMKRKGIVLNEPSVVALRTDGRMEKRVLAVGADAKRMLGKVPSNISAIRPMRNGVIADFEAAGTMLKYFIKKVRNGMTLFRPRIIIAVPFGITPVEKRAVKQAAEQAGAREVFLIEEPMAAAIGADLAITEPTCNMVVDIGGGTTEVAVISLAGIVASRSLRVAGDKMDDAIIRYLRKKYNFIIGERTAELIKTTIGNAFPESHPLETMEVKGWDMILGKPRIFSVDAEEVREAILEQINAIVETVKIVLDRTPQELSADVVKSGIVLTGGVALLKNLDLFLSHETGLPITVANDPLSTVAVGSGKTLDNNDLLQQVIIH
jgi:rod shape-determining protein MreB